MRYNYKIPEGYIYDKGKSPFYKKKYNRVTHYLITYDTYIAVCYNTIIGENIDCEGEVIHINYEYEE